MKLYIIAGEASGDLIGGGILAALRAQLGEHLKIAGVGGQAMQAQGLESLFPMEELSVMGLTEILPKVPHFLKRIRETTEAIEAFQPDVVLTIDSPDFCFRVAKSLQKRRVSGARDPLTYHMVAPTVWAWREGRAKKVAKLYDEILCLFPFEPPYFEAEGMQAHFIGHPMMERLQDVETKSFQEKYSDRNFDSSAPKIGVLFGSRKSEVHRMGEIFTEVIEKLSKHYKGKCCVIIPTFLHLREMIEGLLSAHDKTHVCHTFIIDAPEEKYPALKLCDAAIATSGTVGLELSVLGVPHVIGYRVNSLTFQIAKRLIKTEYAHLTNIMLDQGVVPELIQNDCTAGRLIDETKTLLDEPEMRQRQVQASEQIREMLLPPGQGMTSSEMAAQIILQRVSKSAR